MSGSLLWTGFGDDDLNAQFAMAWDMNMLQPADGTCPTGNVSVSIDQYTLDATWVGDTTFDWELYENGLLVDTGSDFANCSIAAPAGAN